MDQYAHFKLTGPAVPVAVTTAFTRDVPASCFYNKHNKECDCADRTD